MQNRGSVVLSIAVLLAGVAVVSTPALAQGRGGGGDAAAARPGWRRPFRRQGRSRALPDGKPNLEGVFSGMGSGLTHTVILEDHTSGFGIRGGKSLIIDPPDGVIPYQPWALVERNKRREDVNAYEDPVGHCEFYDIGRLHSFAQRFMYTGGNIAIAGQEQIVRIIDMNRKQHLPASIRLWNGDPIGWWEGDTLVIDTTNFNGRTRMALGGDFYSVERPRGRALHDEGLEHHHVDDDDHRSDGVYPALDLHHRGADDAAGRRQQRLEPRPASPRPGVGTRLP